MKKSQLRQIIKEEIKKVLNEDIEAIKENQKDTFAAKSIFEPKLRVKDELGYVEVEGPFSVVGDWMYDWFIDNNHIHGFTVEEID